MIMLRLFLLIWPLVCTDFSHKKTQNPWFQDPYNKKNWKTVLNNPDNLEQKNEGNRKLVDFIQNYKNFLEEIKNNDNDNDEVGIAKKMHKQHAYVEMQVKEDGKIKTVKFYSNRFDGKKIKINGKNDVEPFVYMKKEMEGNGKWEMVQDLESSIDSSDD